MAQDDIQGQVVDPSGNPVSGAIVELTKSFESNPVEEQTVLRTTTDSNGNYIFEFHPDGDGTTQDYHVSCYNHDGTAYVNSFNNPGVTADLSALPDSVVDNFEEVLYEDQGNSLGDYYTEVEDVSLSEWSRETTNPFEGDYSLKFEDGRSNTTSKIIAVPAPNTAPQPGDTIVARMYTDSLGDLFDSQSLLFGVESSDTYFEGNIRVGLDDGVLSARVNDSRTDSYEISASMNTDEWYTFVVDWGTDGTVSFDLEDSSGTVIESGSVSESNISGEGIGFGSRQAPFSDTTRLYYDGVEIQ